MKFWDASAIVPLLADQAPISSLQAVIDNDPTMMVWWGTGIECVSALARLEREHIVSTETIKSANRRLERFAQDWHEIEPSEVLREIAIRFLRVHALRAADALQLAAAYLAAEHRPTSFEFVTLDVRLSTVARKEGFAIIDVELGR